MINHQAGQQIAQRYEILEQLGYGGSGFTYKAQDQQTGNLVALKAFSLGQMETWKQMELFEREAKILQQLDHPAIPQYLDHFQEEIQGKYRFYLVQELAPGQSLATLVEQGWQPQPPEVERIAEQVLDILVDLQALVPPVIHRDIKPENIIYQNDEGSKPGEGNLFLVDFGAVQDAYHHTTVASTVVGTYGYMAPEQYRGQANLSTDLYGLSATLLFLLTGKPPSEFPEHQLKIDFRQEVSISREFADWLDKCLELNLENRFPSAEAALEVWQGKKPIETYASQTLKQPSYSVVELQEKDGELTIEIPPAIFRPRRDRRVVALGIVWHFIFLLPFLEVGSSIHPIWTALYGLAWLGTISGLPDLREKSKCVLWGLLVYAFFSLIQIVSLDDGSIELDWDSWDAFHWISPFLLGLLAIDVYFGDRIRRYWFSDLLRTVHIKLHPSKFFNSSELEVRFLNQFVLQKGKRKIWEKPQRKRAIWKKLRWLQPISLKTVNSVDFQSPPWKSFDTPTSLVKQFAAFITQNSRFKIRIQKNYELSSTFNFGGLLTPMEKNWLTKKIENFLDRNSSQSEIRDG